jgi:hypothetical protein
LRLAGSTRDSLLRRPELSSFEPGKFRLGASEQLDWRDYASLQSIEDISGLDRRPFTHDQVEPKWLRCGLPVAFRHKLDGELAPLGLASDGKTCASPGIRG